MAGITSFDLKQMPVLVKIIHRANTVKISYSVYNLTNYRIKGYYIVGISVIGHVVFFVS